MDKALRAFFERLPRAEAGRPTVAAISVMGIDDLVDLLVASARRLLVAAIDAEFRHFLGSAGIAGTSAVRNGLHPERLIATGVGAVPVRLPKLRGRRGARATFRSALVPRYARRARSLNAEATDLYLRAIATGDLGQALVALIGPQSVALPPPVARELERWWFEQSRAWRDGALPRCETRLEFWSTIASGGANGARHGALDARRGIAHAVTGLPSAPPPCTPACPSAYTKIDPSPGSMKSRPETGQFGEGD